ncbi:MAG: DinB family protein [Ardenticatenaceae bacterium]
MDITPFLSQMAQHAETVRNLCLCVSDEQARWKPDPKSWSMLEVINHLDDEEREDFRARLNFLLHHPEQPWPSTDPAGWVIERQYNQREFDTSLQNFLNARQESLAWLKALEAPRWQNEYFHAPAGRRLSAGDMFTSWLAHDLLHMRQLVELKWAYTSRIMKPFSVDYAGQF